MAQSSSKSTKRRPTTTRCFATTTVKFMHSTIATTVDSSTTGFPSFQNTAETNSASNKVGANKNTS